LLRTVQRWGASIIAIAALLGALVSCGGDDVRYSDAKIIDRLNLEKTENGYRIDGDLFCEVEKKLLNNASEVEAAAEKDELGLVIASREGNAGVSGVPVFAPQCGDEAKRKLNKLDPPPKD
jgi:hypothetical protein